MAQVLGGTSFDFVAMRKHNTAQKVLARAADIWAGDRRDSISIDSVLAVLLHIYLSEFGESGGPGESLRPLQKWLSLVGTAQQEAAAHFPPAVAPRIPEVLALLHAELSCAAEQWCLGHPEQPPTAHALNAVEHILFLHKLIRRPASPRLPRTLCDVQSKVPDA